MSVLLAEIARGDYAVGDSTKSLTTNYRMFSRPMLIAILSELVRSYDVSFGGFCRETWRVGEFSLKTEEVENKLCEERGKAFQCMAEVVVETRETPKEGEEVHRSAIASLLFDYADPSDEPVS